MPEPAVRSARSCCSGSPPAALPRSPAASAWVDGVRRRDAAGALDRCVDRGRDAGEMPLAAALGLVVLACWGVVLVTRGRVRRAVAVLGAARRRSGVAGGRRGRLVRPPGPAAPRRCAECRRATTSATRARRRGTGLPRVGGRRLASSRRPLAVALVPGTGPRWAAGTTRPAPRDAPTPSRRRRSRREPRPLEGDGRGARPDRVTR